MGIAVERVLRSRSNNFMSNSKVVLKFGGSSLSSAGAFKKVAHIISGFLDPVVVVSAVGTRSRGEKKPLIYCTQ